MTHTIDSLAGSHLRTYNMLFQHPVSHNLGWHDVHALFRRIGRVEEVANGNLKVTRNGHTIVLHPALAKDVGDTEEVLRLRHFVERSGEPTDAGDAAHWLLVIDHREARIFSPKSGGGVTLQILPPEPSEHFNHAPDSKDFSRGKERPDPKTYFKPVAEALGSAGPILVFGQGTGMSSEMDRFVAWTKVHHPELAERIVGTQVVDEHHLSPGQLREKARAFFAPRA